MSQPVAEDPVLEAQIEAEVARAAAPYEKLVPPDVLDEMKRLLRLGLHTHPTAQHIFRRLRPAPVVEESGKVDRNGQAASETRPKIGGAR